MVWLGHSSWYLQLAGKRILIDPVFSDYAAPFSFINKAFPVIAVERAADAGDRSADYLRSRYDHLDATIKALMPKVKRVVTPLGVGSALLGNGCVIIDEVDWNQTIKISDELTVRCRLAIFSGRGLKRNQTLWASFLFVTPQERFITAAIAAMARILRPLANSLALSIWQSWKTVNMTADWKYIHMMPEETAQAADDLRARSVLPGHAGRFVLAKRWDDPYQRLAAAGEGRGGVCHANAGRTGVGR